jgi:DNA topoisomerase VI subunit B
MTVSEKNVSDALIYLADDPHPLAVAQFNLATAEATTKQTFARLFLDSNQSTVDAKKASAECHPDHIAAKQVEANAILECERHKRRVRAAESLLEIFRTENANARAAERIR